MSKELHALLFDVQVLAIRRFRCRLLWLEETFRDSTEPTRPDGMSGIILSNVLQAGRCEMADERGVFFLLSQLVNGSGEWMLLLVRAAVLFSLITSCE